MVLGNSFVTYDNIVMLENMLIFIDMFTETFIYTAIYFEIAQQKIGNLT